MEVRFGMPQHHLVFARTQHKHLKIKPGSTTSSLVGSPQVNLCCKLQLLAHMLNQSREAAPGCQQMKMPLNRDEKGWNPLTPGSELYITKMLSSFVREIILKDIFRSVDICVWVINSSAGMEQGGKTLCASLVTSLAATSQATAFSLERSLMPPWPVTLCYFITLICSVISEGRDLGIFHAPFLSTTVAAESLFCCLFSWFLTASIFCCYLLRCSITATVKHRAMALKERDGNSRKQRWTLAFVQGQQKVAVKLQVMKANREAGIFWPSHPAHRWLSRETALSFPNPFRQGCLSLGNLIHCRKVVMCLLGFSTKCFKSMKKKKRKYKL